MFAGDPRHRRADSLFCLTYNESVCHIDFVCVDVVLFFVWFSIFFCFLCNLFCHQHFSFISGAEKILNFQSVFVVTHCCLNDDVDHYVVAVIAIISIHDS